MYRNTRVARTDGIENPSRRTVLRITGTGLTAGSGIAVGGGSAVAADCSEEKCPLDKQTDDYAELIYDEMNSAVELVKEGLEEGNNDDHCEYGYNDDALLVIKPVNCHLGFDGSGCGRTDSSFRVNSNEDTWRYAIYMSHDDTKQAVSALRDGYEFFTIAATILSKKRRHGVILFAAAQASKYTADELESTNEGCGVKILMKCPIVDTGNPMEESWSRRSELDFDLHPQSENVQ